MNEIYKAIFDRLSSQLTESVYDHVPQDLSNYPFVRLDPLQTNVNDADDKAGFTAIIQVVSFSRYRGSKEITDISDNIYNALHRYAMPDTASYGISGIQEVFRKTITLQDGLTRNAVQQYEILFELL